MKTILCWQKNIYYTENYVAWSLSNLARQSKYRLRWSLICHPKWWYLWIGTAGLDGLKETCRAMSCCIEKSFGVIPPKSPKSIGWIGRVLHELAMFFVLRGALSRDFWASSKDQRHGTGGSHYHHPNLYENMSQRHGPGQLAKSHILFLPRVKLRLTL
jgi:hypothetical protein